MSSTLLWLKAFLPAPLAVDARERWRAVAGAAIGIAITALLCRMIVDIGLAADVVGPWLVAPLGASAVLVFAVPASPLAQPWSVVGGNVVSAFVGIVCVRWIPDMAFASAAAVSLAIGAMLALRCLHPPGGAMALLAVLTHATQFQFAFFPAFINSLLLVLMGIAYNSLTGRRYPHVQVLPKSDGARSLGRFTAADLDVVLARYNQVLDISRDDLERVLQLTEMEAYRRKLGSIKCRDIMTSDLIVAEYATTLEEAWALMRQHRIKALPIVDRGRHLLGIVTLADFIKHANVDRHEHFGERIRHFIRYTTTVYSNKSDVVGQIMTTQVRVASEDRHVVELLPLFSEGGHHHIPIVGLNSKLVGMITESDFVRALYRAQASGDA
jgi:CBS domain-containing membrane protein